MSWIKTLPFLLLCACGTSGITAEQLTAAKELVHPLQPKAAARAALVSSLGEPTGEDENASWWQSAGATCKKLKVSWMGDSTGGADIEDC
jgi:hypothetical protein